MLLEKPDDAPLGWLPQTYHQMDLKKRKDPRQSREHRAWARANQGLSARVKGTSAGLTHRRYFHVMRPLRYSINVTLDGCCDHRAIPADEEPHRHAVEDLAQADALLFGRVTYEMKEAAWQPPAGTRAGPAWMEPRMEPFARTIDAAKKYVESSTLDRVDWNAELVRGSWGRPFSSSSGSRVGDCSWEA
jgi:hypothetical protein